MRPRLNVWEVKVTVTALVAPGSASMRPRLNVWEVPNRRLLCHCQPSSFNEAQTQRLGS